MIGSRWAYFFSMVIASLIAARLVHRNQRELSLTKVQKWGIAIGGLVGATFAAKAPFLIEGSEQLGLVGAWISDGKTVLWGLVGGYLGVELAKWAFHVNASTGDTFVVPVATAIAVGRLGCLMYGCCYGTETNQHWGLRFINAPDGGSLLRHPTQLYELAFHAFFALLAYRSLQAGSARTNTMQGNWMPTFIVAYAVYRFFSEFLRPEARMLAGLTFYQWSSIAIAIGFSALVIDRLRSRNDDEFRNIAK